MLNKIPKILPPDLVKIMMQMGHGDELVIGDGNFPCDAMGTRVVRMDGHGVPEILDAILELMPLDPYVEQPTALMSVVPGDDYGQPAVWQTYQEILHRHGHDIPPKWWSALPSMTGPGRLLSAWPARRSSSTPTSS